MAERKSKHDRVPVKNIEQLLRVVDEVVDSNEATPIELQGGRRVTIAPEPPSLAVPANGVNFTPDEIEKRLALIDSLAGVWADIDTEAWKARIREERG